MPRAAVECRRQMQRLIDHLMSTLHHIDDEEKRLRILERLDHWRHNTR